MKNLDLDPKPEQPQQPQLGDNDDDARGGDIWDRPESADAQEAPYEGVEDALNGRR